MKYLLYTAITALFVFETGIYTLKFYKIEGGEQSLSAFQGKKILLVNIATGSNKINQLTELKQLQTQFKDSLAIIAFPSNSFGNEARTNSEIKRFCDSLYQPNFMIAEKGSVKGNDAQPIFHWLADKSENGEGNIPVIGDFQKFLFDENGQLTGVFTGTVLPTHSKIISAIQQ